MTRAIMPFVVASLTWFASAAEAQRYSPASLTHRILDYYGNVYTAVPGPNSPHIYFPGELIQLEIMIVNRGVEPLRLILSDRTVTESFSATFSGGTRFPLHISNNGTLRHPNGDTPIDVGREFTLHPREVLIVGTDVSSNQLKPGAYEVWLSTTIRDPSGLPIAPQGNRVMLEIRPDSSVGAIELARRNGMRAIRSGDALAAEQAIDALLSLHPRSYAAYAMRGLLSELVGARARAHEAYQRAVDILQSGTDELYVRSETSTRNTEKLVEEFTQRMRANDDSSPR